MILQPSPCGLHLRLPRSSKRYRSDSELLAQQSPSPVHLFWSIPPLPGPIQSGKPPAHSRSCIGDHVTPPSRGAGWRPTAFLPNSSGCKYLPRSSFGFFCSGSIRLACAHASCRTPVTCQLTFTRPESVRIVNALSLISSATTARAEVSDHGQLVAEVGVERPRNTTAAGPALCRPCWWSHCRCTR